MNNEKVTGHSDVPASEGADLLAEVVELTERIHVLSLERGIAVRMRNRALVGSYRAGASIRELVELTGLHSEDIAEVVSMPPEVTPR